MRALDAVDFDLRAGEVHLLFGENGAGKSTLISILAGAAKPTSGTLWFRGRQVSLHSVHDARELGISAVFQDFSLVAQMTVEENLFLGEEPRRGAFLDRLRSREHAREILGELGFRIDPAARVDQLTRAEQQMVEIAKAFRSDLSVLILDEPTASLTNHETDQLFNLIGELTARGIGIVYITHRMAEIQQIGSRITVLRDGRYVDTVNAQNASEEDLVQLMTGREVGEIFPARIPSDRGRHGAENRGSDNARRIRQGRFGGNAGGRNRGTCGLGRLGQVRAHAGRFRSQGDCPGGGSIFSVGSPPATGRSETSKTGFSTCLRTGAPRG